MKNVTITLPVEVARWAKVHAAKQDLSLSRLVAEMLRERMVEEEGYQRAMRSYFSRKPERLKAEGSYPSRDELYE